MLPRPPPWKGWSQQQPPLGLRRTPIPMPTPPSRGLRRGRRVRLRAVALTTRGVLPRRLPLLLAVTSDGWIEAFPRRQPECGAFPPCPIVVVFRVCGAREERGVLFLDERFCVWGSRQASEDAFLPSAFYSQRPSGKSSIQYVFLCIRIVLSYIRTYTCAPFLCTRARSREVCTRNSVVFPHMAALTPPRVHK